MSKWLHAFRRLFNGGKLVTVTDDEYYCIVGSRNRAESGIVPVRLNTGIRSEKMANVSFEKIVGAVDLSKSQTAALKKLFGPEYTEGAIYRRTDPDCPSKGDLYIATKKLGEGVNMEGGYDMLNLTRKDRNHVLAKFDPSKFALVAADARAAGIKG